MIIEMPRFCRTLLTTAFTVAVAGALHAQTYIEIGDAGSSQATAQPTGVTGGVALDSISGSILNGNDGDFFLVDITNPATFSATTVGGSTLDTMLYLFTLAGNPLFLNDDAPGGASVQSTLPPGNAFGPLVAGTYILGISLSGAEPINIGNQLLFADPTFSTEIRGPRAGALGPVTGVTPATFSETGLYTIALTGASTAVPEPSSVALLALAGVGALAAWRRRANARRA